jgi:hypothetical protein
MSKNTATTEIVLFLIVTIGASMLLVQPTIAHTPTWEIPTYAYINVSPDPCGVGQEALIVMFLDKVIDGARVENDIRFHDFKLTITDPDGNIETKTWDIIWDTTSSQYISYTPTKVGTYTLKFEYPGQTYTWSGNYQNDIYLPSSKTTTFTVQEESIAKTPEAPLPTEYWTRPIEGTNTGWASITSNFLYPFTRSSRYSKERLQSDGTAPNSAHIMWTKPIAFGGVVGGSGGVQGGTDIPGITYYSGIAYEHKFTGSLIMYGRLYYKLPRSNDGSGGGYACVDLRTGEEIWRQNYEVDPTRCHLERLFMGNFRRQLDGL